MGRRHDFSYGLYIYGWPVMQLATYFGVPTFGHLAYLAISVVATGVLAIASWYIVESPALRLKSAAVPAALRTPARPE